MTMEIRNLLSLARTHILRMLMKIYIQTGQLYFNSGQQDPGTIYIYIYIYIDPRLKNADNEKKRKKTKRVTKMRQKPRMQLGMILLQPVLENFWRLFEFLI